MSKRKRENRVDYKNKIVNLQKARKIKNGKNIKNRQFQF